MHPGGLEMWQEDCTTRGLYALGVMFAASDADARLEAAGNTECPNTTMLDSLSVLRGKRVSLTTEAYTYVSEPGFAVGENETVILSWAKKTNKWCEYEVDEKEIQGLPRWGYVIWDHCRLEDLGVLKLWYV
jgi:hypothetical protein